MTYPLSVGFKNQFDDQIREAIQQSVSKLKDKVHLERIDAEYKFIDNISKTSVEKNNSVYAKVTPQEPTLSRRRLSADRFVYSVRFDENQFLKLQNDVQYQTKTVSQMQAAFQRKMDKVIVEALLADVYTGKAGTIAVTAATDGVIEVDATAGLTYEKLLEARDILMSKGYSIEDNNPLYHLITNQELLRYHKETELTDGDFTGANAVMRDPKTGMIKNALGIEFITFASNPSGASNTEPILDVDDSSVRSCFMLAGKASSVGFNGSVTLGIQRALSWKIVELDDYHDVHLLKAKMNIGAVREIGDAIVHVKTTSY